MARYGWTWAQYRETPEWVIEEALTIMQGEAEAAALRTSLNPSSGYAPDMAGRSASELARAGGLPPPPGGWPDG